MPIKFMYILLQLSFLIKGQHLHTFGEYLGIVCILWTLNFLYFLVRF